MSAVVQATCPGCQHVLRIPADWLGQAFKCKHCGTIIQARAKAPDPAADRRPARRRTGGPPGGEAGRRRPPRRRPATKPARPSSADPFSFDDDDVARFLTPAAPAPAVRAADCSRD